MLREEVKKVWEKLKEEVEILCTEISSYRTCFIIIDRSSFEPLGHNKYRELRYSGLVNEVVTNDSSLEINLPFKLHNELRYTYDERVFFSFPMVVLISHPIMEEVD